MMKMEVIVEGEYRYVLTRRWGNKTTPLQIVMLNPSTADDKKDDNTIRACMGIARLWGFDAIDVRNLFALRTPKPDELSKHPDPIGPKNDDYLRELEGTVLCAWGSYGKLMGRADRAPIVAKRVALGFSAGGQPYHPLAFKYMDMPFPEVAVPWS